MSLSKTAAVRAVVAFVTVTVVRERGGWRRCRTGGLGEKRRVRRGRRTDDCELSNDTDLTDQDTDGDGTPDGREV